jgi:branched-chain amino acid transport system permease protein
VGYPALRLRGAYFAVTTFYLAHFMYLIFLNEVSLTGGPLGFKGIRPPEPIGPLSFESIESGYFLILVSFVIIYLLLRRLVNTNIGYVLRSIAQDDILAESIGINTAMYKLLAFVISAVIAGYAGVLYAHFFRLLHPTTFSWFLSEMVVIMTLVGGAGSLIGPILGAAIVTFILELLRFAPEIRYISWAIALLAILMFEPRGLIGFIKRLKGR